MFLLPENIAKEKMTYESSVAWSGESYKAVDGNTDTDFMNGSSCTHTLEESNPWWMVDLGYEADISRVEITNRAKLGKFEVLFANVP